MTAGAARFVLSIEPLAGESLPSYVIRLAHRNRLPAADLVAARAGLRQPGLAFAYANLSRLAALADVDAERLEALAYRPTSRAGYYSFLGGVLQREFIDLKRRRACPECLQGIQYHRTAWDLALATCCMVHGVRLISACPNCKRPLNWSWPDLACCRCGVRLCSRISHSVTAAERGSQAAVLAIASGGDLPMMPAELRVADRADLIRLVMCLGMFLTGWKRERRVETLVADGSDMVARVVEAGVWCLRYWPASLLGFFDRERERADSRCGRYGARKTLGAFYDWLNMMEAGPIKSTLASVASSFLTSDPVLARLAHRSELVAGVADPARPVTMAEAASRIGARERKVKKLVEAGLLSGHVSTGPGSMGLLDGQAVQRLAELTSDALDLSTTARRLGVSKARVRRLVEEEVIAPLHRGNAAGWGRWMFAQAAIGELLRRLTSKVMPEAGGTVGFETAAEILRRRGVALTSMLHAILDGKLPVVGLDHQSTGLKTLRFREADLRALHAGQQDPARMLTTQEAARELGLKSQVLAHLLEAGLIGREEGGIRLASLAAFRSAFVSGAELARARNTSPRHLAAVLAKRGVRPVAGPEVDGSRQNFYRRDSVD